MKAVETEKISTVSWVMWDGRGGNTVGVVVVGTKGGDDDEEGWVTGPVL